MAKSKQAKFDKWAAKGKADKIAPFIKAGDPEIRKEAAISLAKVDNDESFNALVGALHDRELSVRMAVVNSLVAIKRTAAAEHLRHAYGSTSEPEFVEACKAALTALLDKKR